MKTQRRRDRAGRSPATDPISNGMDGASDDVSLEGGESFVAEASDGANGRGSGNGQGNGHTVQAASQAVAPTLPKRRKRVDAPAPVVESITETLPERPSKKVKTAPPPVETVAPDTSAGGGWRAFITYENLFWLGIFLVALVTRFWDIGNRGIHHDESLHAHFSRLLYAGQGYTHDPMMHGPLQFHLIGFMYWLFGTTDATARFASAFCGLFVVMSPFFLRRQMGKMAAMVAGFLLLVSPSVLYFSRMAREDAIFSAMEMIFIVGLWRFISTRRPGDFFVMCAGLSLMFTIKETAYLTTAILAVFFLVLFAYQSGYAILGALGAYVAGLGGLALFVKMNTVVLDPNTRQVVSGTIPELPNIPSTNPNYEMIINFVTALLTHPLVWGAVVLTVAFVVGLVVLFRMQAARLSAQAIADRPAVMRRAVGSLPSRRVRAEAPEAVEVVEVRGNGTDIPEPPVVAASTEVIAEGPEDEVTEVWDRTRLDPKPGTLFSRYEAGSLPYLVGALFSRPKVLLLGLAIAAAIFTVLYTVFFTDMPRGIASGLFASLGYWMAQHDVRRGDQPWFYYMLLIPLYEPIAVFFSAAAGTFFSWRGIRWLFRRRSEARYETAPARLGAFNTDRQVPFAKFSVFLPLFIAWWLLGATAIYSWAGEKMPWLMVHMVRPAIFFAALFIGALLASLIARRRARIAGAGLTFAPVPAPAAPLVEESTLPGRRRSPALKASAPPPPPLRTQAPPWEVWNKPGSWFPILSFLGLFTLLAFSWGLTMNAFIFANNYGSWWMTWLFPLAMIALTAAYAVWLGPGRALRYLGMGILALGLIYQFRSAVNLTYNHPDVTTEMAVYVQTSPDMTRIMREIDAYSALTTGGKDVKIMYDGFASWPFVWYLRDYKNAQLIGQGAEANPDVATTPILLLEYGVHKDKPQLLENYIPQRYAMRWWFPQDWYMQRFLPGQDYRTAPATSQIGGAINTVWTSITTPQNQAQVWKYLVFREPPQELGSEDLILFLRKDIAQQFHYIQYAPPPSTDVP
jgi:predicted membrane-bound mannosyltransferase